MQYIYTPQYYTEEPTLNNIFSGTSSNTICVGSSFIPNTNEDEYEKYAISLSDGSLLKNNFDHTKEFLQYMSTFMGQLSDKLNDGYLGKWDRTLETNDKIKLYYIITDNDICPFVITSNINQKSNDITGCNYIIIINDKMYDAVPEHGDLIFDTKDEALQYKKQLKNKRR